MATKPYIWIQGGLPLKGEVRCSGAKNSVLPLLFSTLLADGKYTFHNVPSLEDVSVAKEILKSFGCLVSQNGNTVTIQSQPVKTTTLNPELAQKMRASFLCLGPLLTRYKQAQIPLPGGCQIGLRPVNLHLKGLQALGASIRIEENWVYAEAPQGLKGAQVHFDFPTVGGTENLIMAGVLSEGETVIQNRALEPEISDLIEGLKKMGASIEETGPQELTLKGVKNLKSFEHTVMPDRIEAGTLLLAGAITGGEVTVTHCVPEHLKAFLKALKLCGFECSVKKDQITVQATKSKKAIHLETGVYPYFPTDLQAQFVALMTQLEGQSSLKENVFEKRFGYVKELKKLQAQIEIQESQTVFIQGQANPLKGCHVQATDLRASAGLILAGLVAEGETFVTNIFHLNRGYDDLDSKLLSLGARIKKVI